MHERQVRMSLNKEELIRCSEEYSSSHTQHFHDKLKLIFCGPDMFDDRIAEYLLECLVLKGKHPTCVADKTFIVVQRSNPRQVFDPEAGITPTRRLKGVKEKISKRYLLITRYPDI